MSKNIKNSAHAGAPLRATPIALACSLLMLGASGYSGAQEAAPATPAEATATAQTAESPAKTDNPGMTTVRVTGIRSGIEAAVSIKKNATSIVEAISAEDIGKLPDSTVAESLSRLSGVTTQRDKVNGKATQVSVRGLSPSFNGSLLNGREQASTGDARNPEFDLFPAELTGSVLVYKTPTASVIGQGLAATIDLRTLRPLEFDTRKIAASIRKERIGVDAGGEEGSGHRKTLSYIDQFANRTIGLSLGVTSFKQDNGDELSFDSWGGYLPDRPYNGGTVKVIGGFLSETAHRKNDRDSATATLQFRPNAKFKTSVDLFYSRGTETTSRVGLEGAIATNAGIYDPDGVLSNATIVNGIATSGTVSNYKGDIRNNMFRGKDNFKSVGWNAEYKLNDWRLEGDLSYSKGHRYNANYETIAGQPGNTPASQLGSISYSGFDGTNFQSVKYTPSLDYTDRSVMKLTDVDGWGGGPLTPQAGYLAQSKIDDKLKSARMTAHRELDWGPVIGAHVGVNLSKREKSRLGDGEGRLSVNGGDGYAAATIPGTNTAIAGPVGIRVAQFDPTGTLGTIYSMNTWVDAAVLARDWVVTEKVNTLYAMADVDSKLFGIPYTGNAGIQVVRTDQEGQGNQVDQSKCTGITVDTCLFTINRDGIKYTNVLPSMNLAFDLGDDKVLRVGAGKQMSRANLDNMRAGLNYSLPTSSPYDPALSGTGGNPRLKPYMARSLDLSFEKYFGNRGYVSAAFFFKKLDNYVINAPRGFDFAPYVSSTTPLPATGEFKGSTIGFLTTPVNGQGGTMRGIELAMNLPFSLLWRPLDGFGATVNYSYTDSSVTLPTSGFITASNKPVFADQVSEIGLPGLSKNVSSLRLYYEKSGFQMSYTIRNRSSFVGEIKDYRSDSQFTFIRSETIADIQGSYEFQSGWLKGVSIFAQANNLTNTPFREFTKDPDIVTTSRSYGKFYAAGVNVKF
ncbi:TonB-dependent receptor [Duganella sp. CF517]|uniref:TonB-dependent receptor n=1 Tax=Duganella sp. CF517 TaxID=1881038 RepID=UPI001E4CB33E|nr:TonB-dependent receptor [Duganella sp. CF517]